MVGGGHRAKPGEVSLAHGGVLFLDELPEFNRPVLEALRQPLEPGRVTVARANGHITYPARVMFVAAMNPCRCGFLDDASQACARVPKCAREYQDKISGPMLGRIDLHVDVPAVEVADLALPPASEDSATVAARVTAAREIQSQRFMDVDAVRTNAEADGELLSKVATPEVDGKDLLTEAAKKMSLSAGVITGCCAWPEPWPTWMRAALCAVNMWPRTCPTAASPSLDTRQGDRNSFHDR